MYIGSEHVYI